MSQPVFMPGVNVAGSTLVLQVDNAPVREQQRGNHDWQDALTLDDCVVLAAEPTTGRVSALEGKLYVPRGSAVTDDMRFFYQGVWWGVRGPARFDFDHVLTGEDFGYVEFTIVKGG
jgi:hypothetical protein